MRDFRKLDIWVGGIKLVKYVYLFSKKLPEFEKFGLISQMRRAAVSIPSNISEGASRNIDIEFKRFLEISIGSAFELETQLILCVELGFIKKEEINKILEELNLLQKQINSLISKIRTANSKRPKANS